VSVGTLTHRYAVAASPSEVAAYLTDPAHYVGLNPFAIKVHDVRERDGAVEFRAVERIRLFGPLHRNNALHLVIRSEVSGERVVYDVKSQGGITVDIVLELAPLDGGTDIQDTMTLTVPRPVRAFALKQARVGQLHRADVLGRLGRSTDGTDPPR
jgi:hypothetical protein